MINNSTIRTLGAAVTLVAVVACGDTAIPSSPTSSDGTEEPGRSTTGPILSDVNIDPVQLKEFDPFTLWWNVVPESSEPARRDEDGVPLTFRGGEWGYHPVNITVRAFWQLERYRQGQGDEHLRRAQTYAAILLREADERNGGLYLPYTFDFWLHGQARYDKLEAPWYSGMAQGQMLALLSRLYRLTGDISHLVSARQVFATLTVSAPPAHRQTSSSDSTGYYWINEYPTADPPLVLNGYIFALRGIYEYWWTLGNLESHNPGRSDRLDDPITKSLVAVPRAQSEAVLQAALTTLQHYLPSFRMTDSISFYCLKHRYQNARYHATHVRLVDDLDAMTVDRWFGAFADSLRSDY